MVENEGEGTNSHWGGTDSTMERKQHKGIDYDECCNQFQRDACMRNVLIPMAYNRFQMRCSDKRIDSHNVGTYLTCMESNMMSLEPIPPHKTFNLQCFLF